MIRGASNLLKSFERSQAFTWLSPPGGDDHLITALNIGRVQVRPRIAALDSLILLTYTNIYGVSPSAAGPLDSLVARWLSG